MGFFDKLFGGKAASETKFSGQKMTVMLPIDGKVIPLEQLPDETFASAILAGHFPNEPVMPGVLIVEAMAQAGAVAILSMDEFKGKTAYFGGINKAKFKKKVVPGDTLRLEVKIEKLKKNAGIGQGTAYVGDKVAAQAELVFMIG